MNEKWKVIKDYPAYSISSLGRIKNNSTGRIRKTTISAKGYERVGIYGKTIGKKQPDIKAVSRLVAESFIANPQNKKEVNHINGNKLDNKVSNLEWATSSENQLHAYINKLQIHVHGSGHFAAKITEKQVIKIRKMWKTGKHFQWQIAEKFGINQQNVSLICNDKAWKHI